MVDRSSAPAPAASPWRRWVGVLLVLVAAFAFALLLTRYPGEGAGVLGKALAGDNEPAGIRAEPQTVPASEVWPAQ